MKHDSPTPAEVGCGSSRTLQIRKKPSSQIPIYLLCFPEEMANQDRAVEKLERAINQMPASASAQRGRKPAKHSDPDYVQTSLYLPRQLKNTVRARLLEQGKEFSGLVEDMLREWLTRQQA